MKSFKFFSQENLLPIFLFIFAIAINQFSGNRGVFPADSFSHFDIGFRILLGDHPFKDYWAVSGPFIDYIQGFIFYILGVNWQTYILNASLLNGILTLTIYYLLVDLNLEKKISFFYAICFAILAYPSSGTPFVDHHSTFLSLLALVIFIKAMKKENSILWLLIPTLMTFSFLSKQVPATYILIIIIIVLLFHFFSNSKKKNLKIITLLFFSSILTTLFIFLFLKLNSVSIHNFFDQYISYPRNIGEKRFSNLNIDLKNIFLNFKFIYLSLIIFTFLIIKNILKKKINFKSLDFKIFLIIFFLFIFLVQHTILTKNQIFIFFLIPFISAFAHVQISKENKKIKFFLTYFLLVLCIFTSVKYHLRFNIDRKFHEFRNINFSNSIDAKILSKKFQGLNWITPDKKTRNNVKEELDYLKKMHQFIKQDKSNKIVLTNYSFFSILLEENTYGFTRWYPQDGSAFPIRGNIFYKNYQQFLKDLILEKKIKNVYILRDVNESVILDYIQVNCFKKVLKNEHLIKYEIINCKDFVFSGKKN